MKFLKTLSGLMSIIILIILLLAASPERSIAIQNQALADGYNGDPFADLVVGVPGESVSVVSNDYDEAGMIHVIFGFPQGLGPQDNRTFHQSMKFSEDQAEADDRFGSALASGDFNGDGNYDVAVGVPLEDITDGLVTEDAAGAVHIIYGSDSIDLSPTGNQFWNQDTPDIEDQAEYEDQFGRSLAVGNFNGDAYDDLAIGVPYEDFERAVTIDDAGCVVVIYGSAGGLSATAVLPDQIWHQDSPDIIDNVEEDDNFGYALAAGNFDNDNYDDLAIGAPGESSSVKDYMGVVHVLYGTTAGLSAARNQQWEQYDWGGGAQSENYDLFGAALAVGDFEGDGYDDLAVGIPNEDIETPSITIENAGAVNILFGSGSGLKKDRVQFLYQDGENIAEDAEEWDHFGYALAAVNFNGLTEDYLVVGVPDEDLGNPEVMDAGAVHVLTRSWFGGFVGESSRYFHQGRGSIPDELEGCASFGYSLAPGDFNGDGKEDLAIGAPLDNCNTSDDGSVVVIYEDNWELQNGLSPQRLCQGGVLEDEGEADDNFGYALVSLPGSGALPYRRYLPTIMRGD